MTPINMILHCPRCGLQHVDKQTENWPNNPHRSHLCAECKTVWRPADVATNGVERIISVGQADNWTPNNKAFATLRGDAILEGVRDLANDIEKVIKQNLGTYKRDYENG